MSGHFIVSQDTQDKRDIRFQLTEDSSPVPKDEADLKNEIESVLTIIRLLLPNDTDFEKYFRQLLSLAQAGLAGPHANPPIASGALLALKNEITAREGGKIKNRYMKALAVNALYIGAPAIVLGTAIRLFVYCWSYDLSSTVVVISNFCFLWGACMAGVWLSFGARKTFLKFEDLHIPEEDRLEPAVRLFFAGLLTIILALSFSLKAVVVHLGGISSEEINNSVRAAVLIGLLGGFSEKALSSAVAKQASQLFSLTK